MHPCACIYSVSTHRGVHDTQTHTIAVRWNSLKQVENLHSLLFFAFFKLYICVCHVWNMCLYIFSHAHPCTVSPAFFKRQNTMDDTTLHNSSRPEGDVTSTDRIREFEVDSSFLTLEVDKAISAQRSTYLLTCSGAFDCVNHFLKDLKWLKTHPVDTDCRTDKFMNWVWSICVQSVTVTGQIHPLNLPNFK